MFDLLCGALPLRGMLLQLWGPSGRAVPGRGPTACVATQIWSCGRAEEGWADGTTLCAPAFLGSSVAGTWDPFGWPARMKGAWAAWQERP